MKKIFLCLLIILLLATIIAFLLGHWKIGIILGGIFTWIIVQTGEFFQMKNSEYVYSYRAEPKKNFKKYRD